MEGCKSAGWAPSSAVMRARAEARSEGVGSASM